MAIISKFSNFVNESDENGGIVMNEMKKIMEKKHGDHKAKVNEMMKEMLEEAYSDDNKVDEEEMANIKEMVKEEYGILAESCLSEMMLEKYK